MDLTSKRCGCGAIYRPAVRTQNTCDMCGSRQREESRAKLGAQLDYSPHRPKWKKDDVVEVKTLHSSLPAGPTYSYCNGAVFNRVLDDTERALVQQHIADAHGIATRSAESTMSTKPPIHLASGSDLDGWGVVLGTSRGIEYEIDPSTGEFAKKLESDSTYRLELLRQMRTRFFVPRGGKF